MKSARGQQIGVWGDAQGQGRVALTNCKSGPEARAGGKGWRQGPEARAGCEAAGKARGVIGHLWGSAGDGRAGATRGQAVLWL